MKSAPMLPLIVSVGIGLSGCDFSLSGSGGSAVPPSQPDSLTTLRSLVVSSGHLSPAFASGVLSYKDTVASTVTTFSLAATVSTTGSTIQLNGVTITSGSNRLVSIARDTMLSIVVTNSTTKVKHTYTIKVIHLVPATVVDTSTTEFPWNSAVTYGSMKDPRDGKIYRTVKIGTQTWMAQNLNHDTLIGTGSWCYDNDTSNCRIYGRLYSWSAAMGISAIYSSTIWGGSDVARQGVCPNGWHLPSDPEWDTLIDFIGGASVAALALKSTAGWTTEVGNGTDEYGFRLIPGGGRDKKGYYFDGEDYSQVWSSTEYDDSMSWYRGIQSNDYTVVGQYRWYKAYGLSVRCIKN
jgi:uncharacterized protein (TIGR02145 family)